MVVIAKRQIHKGEKFDRDSVAEIPVSKIDPTPILKYFPSTSAMVLGQRASKEIPENSLIKYRDILKSDEDMR